MFGNTASEKGNFPQAGQCILLLHSTSRELLQQPTFEYIQLLCFAIISGIPFVTLHIDMNESLDTALRKISFYCCCAMICTFDEQIVTLLSQSSSIDICKDLGLKHIIYYGYNEPRAIVRSIHGSSCMEDPISNILKPTKEEIVEQNYKNSSLWEYLPKIPYSQFDIHQYKQKIASTKGVSLVNLENCKQEVLRRAAKWRLNQKTTEPPIHIFGQANDAPRVMTVHNFIKVSLRVEEAISALLHELNNSKVPVSTHYVSVIFRVFLAIYMVILIYFLLGKLSWSDNDYFTCRSPNVSFLGFVLHKKCFIIHISTDTETFR